MLPQLTIGATYFLAAFIIMSGLGMLVIVLAAFLYIFSVNGSDKTYFPVDTVLAAFAFLARGKFAMASMLQAMALYNCIGGGAVWAIAVLTLFGNKAQGITQLAVTMIGALIGAVSLSGSLIAWAKLGDGINKPLGVRRGQVFGGVVMLATLAIGGGILFTARGGADHLNTALWFSSLLLGGALIFGILMTLVIGRAHAPVVISIYNAMIGFSVGLEEFVLRNPTLMVAGFMIGAARMLLTLQMADAGAGRPFRGEKLSPSTVECEAQVDTTFSKLIRRHRAS